MGEEENKSSIMQGHILAHPKRFAILKYLNENPSAHISEIADGTKMNSAYVSFHLRTLKRNGFVDEEYKISEQSESPGTVVREYKLTPKAKELYPFAGFVEKSRQ